MSLWLAIAVSARVLLASCQVCSAARTMRSKPSHSEYSAAAEWCLPALVLSGGQIQGVCGGRRVNADRSSDSSAWVDESA
jgi:hypothetical protein